MIKFIFLFLILIPFAHSANVKISSLPIGSAADTGSNDSFPYVDATTGVTKRMLIWDIINIPPFTTDYLSSDLTSGYIFVGNSSNIATGVAMSGDVTISNAGVATVDATSANTASKIVKRDGSGNFSAGTITATLTGTASGNIANTLTTTTGDMIYASSANTPARLAKGTQFQVLTGGATVPTWGQVALNQATAITGTLPVGNGGTGLTGGTSGGIPYYSGASTLASSGALTANQLVIGGGAGVAPSSLAAGSQYQVLRMGASNPAYGSINLDQAAAVTGILPNANTTATSANTNSAIVARDGSGNFSAGTVTAALSGNATTATALAANPSDCSANQFANAIAANGNLTCAALATADMPAVATSAISRNSSSTTYNSQVIEHARINCSSSATISAQSGAWVSSVANISSGCCDLTLASGIFSSAPTCVSNVNWAAALEYESTASASSSTAVKVCASLAGVPITSNTINVICMGAQ